MKRLIIVSNRLPFKIDIEKDEPVLIPSIGGLATGMKAIYKDYESLWFGWPGFGEEDVSQKFKNKTGKALDKERCRPVYIEKDDIELYYSGFSNKTIWPLFHYFMQYAVFEDKYWEAYKGVNRKFADEILKIIKPGDRVWIHDYHLMLLPKLIRDEAPDVSIGFFLHIPFPSYELFRVLPWRIEILEGLLGSDLVGFHIYDYERHFLSSVRRLLGLDIYLNRIKMRNRIVRSDSFPMGIDYNKFYNESLKSNQRSEDERSDIRKEIDKYFLNHPGRKIMLSIDRLDYSKGIPNRLIAFDHFLGKYPEYHHKVTLIMLAVPSRIDVEHYQMMKDEIDRLVGIINGRYGTITWTPVRYFYRALPFENLAELYSSAEIALITPVRDGMNLVAKEYLATRVKGSGVLVISEMTGAAKELNEAVKINPFDKDGTAEGIKQALEMPEDEQVERNQLMQKRIKRYDIKRWAADFMNSLDRVAASQKEYLSKKITPQISRDIASLYKKAGKRAFFIDFSGTLVNVQGDINKQEPYGELFKLIRKYTKDKKNDIVLLTEREKENAAGLFPPDEYTLIAEHGLWIREPDSDWVQTTSEHSSNYWKDIVRPMIQSYTDRTPASSFIEKSHSISWLYRDADPDLVVSRAAELKDELSSLVANMNLEVLEGNRVLEVKNTSFNKGKAAMAYLQKKNYDFILAMGDDYIDEYLFQELPEDTITIKVGLSKTFAKYNLESLEEARSFLDDLLTD
ncbi:MAG: bifunctional alpha,alpha-trehalose-phosphate synthase (UDP-forming)/trehalose-phosphatase [Bacteroidales bacterium]|nr:bifunctional alpha,alpha-trehalose-phosphate synthase (UDP-forming)/trehalose-phosphatase [Bacteroidales bacterium]